MHRADDRGQLSPDNAFSPFSPGSPPPRLAAVDALPLAAEVGAVRLPPPTKPPTSAAAAAAAALPAAAVAIALSSRASTGQSHGDDGDTHYWSQAQPDPA
ncbi:hypothetical protein AK830_g12159 [Neonectria ditissima]|uniref:Uncharacterized protein n=1 Tax=Neonectria ditissima TaxID=78410 RepID=A0A0P7B121_9HYPO|nr:hypothetical protein AK830_g12159 [Neonectria ditissima]